MSILIKGMEMPKSCHECPLLYVTSLCDGLKDCPLVSVPPHGRLIDADKLLKESEYIMDMVGRTLIPRKEIYNAPTVIEAEDGES